MVERGERGALAAPRREPGPAPRDAGAHGSLPGPVLCRDLPGRHRAPGACGSTNARAPLSDAGALAPTGMEQRCCTHTCQLTSRDSSVGSCTPHETGIAALLMETRANREHMLYLQWVGVGSVFRTLLVFLIRQCRWCLLRKGLWGRGDVLTFCWCRWNARNPPTSQLSTGGA